MLSLVLIGPVFFLLIETSLTKGWKAALALDAGVVFADLICIFLAYYGSKDLVKYIEMHPSLFRIGGFIIMIYGAIMYFSKPKLHLNNEALVSKRYFRTFMNGFLMNILNIGVVVFWFVVSVWVTFNYPGKYEFISFIGIAIVVFLCIDMAKIFLAHRFKRKMTDNLVYKIRKWIGVILFVFGLFILLKGFMSFDPLEQVLPAIPFEK